VAYWGERWLERLHRDLTEDPDAYGLCGRATVMGRQLVLAVADLRERDGVPGNMPLVPDEAPRSDSRVRWRCASAGGGRDLVSQHRSGD
jgi:hypothetical protein